MAPIKPLTPATMRLMTIDEFERLITSGERLSIFALLNQELAQHIQKNHWGKNRPLNKQHAAGYMRDMQRGLWTPNTDALGFTKNQLQNNGYNRIWAAANAESPPIRSVPMLFAFGMEDEETANIDTGKTKNLAQHMRLNDPYTKYQTQRVAAARVLGALDFGAWQARFTRTELQEIIAKDKRSVDAVMNELYAHRRYLKTVSALTTSNATGAFIYMHRCNPSLVERTMKLLVSPKRAKNDCVLKLELLAQDLAKARGKDALWLVTLKIIWVFVQTARHRPVTRLPADSKVLEILKQVTDKYGKKGALNLGRIASTIDIANNTKVDPSKVKHTLSPDDE